MGIVGHILFFIKVTNDCIKKLKEVFTGTWLAIKLESNQYKAHRSVSCTLAKSPLKSII